MVRYKLEGLNNLLLPVVLPEQIAPDTPAFAQGYVGR